MNPEIDLEFWWIVNKSNYESYSQKYLRVFCISHAGGITARLTGQTFVPQQNKNILPSYIKTGLSGEQTCMEEEEGDEGVVGDNK